MVSALEATSDSWPTGEVEIKPDIYQMTDRELLLEMVQEYRALKQLVGSLVAALQESPMGKMLPGLDLLGK